MAHPAGASFYFMGIQFNSDSDDQDLVSLLNDETHQDDTSYPLKEKTRDLNRAYKKIWAAIYKSYGGWQWDDKNNSDFAKAKAQLNSGQKDYDIPDTSLTLRGVEVKTTGGTWYPLIPLTEEQVKQSGYAEIEFQDTTGQPRYYIPNGNSFNIYPAANYTQAASIRTLFDRGVSVFASTDTTKEPGFDDEFHEDIVLGASYYWKRRNTVPDAMQAKADWFEALDNIQKIYSQRYREKHPQRIIVYDISQEMI